MCLRSFLYVEKRRLIFVVNVALPSVRRPATLSGVQTDASILLKLLPAGSLTFFLMRLDPRFAARDVSLLTSHCICYIMMTAYNHIAPSYRQKITFGYFWLKTILKSRLLVKVGFSSYCGRSVFLIYFF